VVVVKRHPVTSAMIARVRIDDERAGPPRFRCVSQRIDKFGGSFERKVKRHPAEFFDSLGNALETCHQRFANVNGRNTTTVRLKFNPTTPTPALPVLLQTETSRNEDKILRSNC
jgi:hypothetical protein